MFAQPVECPLNVYTPGMSSTKIYVNGTQVTTGGSETNTVQSYDIAQYMHVGRNMVYVQCESTLETTDYAADGSIPAYGYTIADFQAYDASLSDAPIDCDDNPYEFKAAVGKLINSDEINLRTIKTGDFIS